MAVSSVGLRLKCDCSGKAQKQFTSKLQTRFLVREDALKAEQRNCPTKEEERNKLWSRVPKGGPIPRRTGRLTVGRKKNSTPTIPLPPQHPQTMLHTNTEPYAYISVQASSVTAQPVCVHCSPWHTLVCMGQ
jgi:hypothetical protein